MPIYVYECCLCHCRFERRQHFHEAAVSFCPECQGEARRVLHSVPIIYKGSGFYTTDHGSGYSPPSSSSEKKRTAEEKTEAGAEEG